jgi:hypothetical protein
MVITNKARVTRAGGSFTARKTASNTWELDIVHTGRLAGEKNTLVVRKEGKDLIVADKEMADEPDSTESNLHTPPPVHSLAFPLAPKSPTYLLA